MKKVLEKMFKTLITSAIILLVAIISTSILNAIQHFSSTIFKIL